MNYDNSELSLPKMILFDYGHTLIYESAFDDTRGYEALMPHITRNDKNLSPKEIAGFANQLFMDIGRLSRDQGIEIHDRMFQRLLFEYLEIEYSLSGDELDQLYWDNAAPGAAMSGVNKMLSYINGLGIRSGVISNISFSENTLTDRLNRLLPENRFEFIMASSEYVYRKPNKMLFEIALKKAHLKPEEVWYCGDNLDCDIKGAFGAGIFPVWYESSLVCPYRKSQPEAKPECPHLHIHEWDELITALKSLI